MKINIKLPVVYSYYETNFVFQELINLDPIEALIIGLVYYKKEKKIELERLEKAIGDVYNVKKSSLADFFYEAFERLIKSSTLLVDAGLDDDYRNILIGNISLHPNIQRNFLKGKFYGHDEKPIIRKKNYGSKIFNSKGYEEINIQEFKRNLDEFFSDVERQNLIDKNKAENSNYKDLLDQEAEKMCKSNQSYIKNNMELEKNDLYKSFENIFFKLEQFEFDIYVNDDYNWEILAVNEASQAIIKLFKEKKCYLKFNYLISQSIKEQTEQLIEKFEIPENKHEDEKMVPISPEGLKVLSQDLNSGERVYYDQKFFLIGEKLNLVFTKKNQIELSVDDQKFSYEMPSIYKKDVTNIMEEYFKVFFEMNNVKFIRNILKLAPVAKKTQLIYLLMNNEKLIDTYHEILGENKDLVVDFIYPMSYENIINKYFHTKIKTLILNFLKNEFSENKKALHKITKIDYEYSKDIINHLSISYQDFNDQKIFVNSKLENDILEFFKDFSFIKNSLEKNDYEELSFKIKNFIKEEKLNDIIFKFLFQKINQRIEYILIEEEKKLNSLCTNLAKENRDIIEPLFDNKNELYQEIEKMQEINPNQKFEESKFKGKWNSNHQFLHAGKKIVEKDLEIVKNNKIYFEEFAKWFKEKKGK